MSSVYADYVALLEKIKLLKNENVKQTYKSLWRQPNIMPKRMNRLQEKAPYFAHHRRLWFH